MEKIFVSQCSENLIDLRTQLLNEIKSSGGIAIESQSNELKDSIPLIEASHASVHLLDPDEAIQSKSDLATEQLDYAFTASSEMKPVFTLCRSSPNLETHLPPSLENLAQRQRLNRLASLKTMNPRARIFISYAHEDGSEHAKALNENMRDFLRHGDAEIWWDRGLKAGEIWDDRIQDEIKSCDFFVILITPGWNSSQYAYEREFMEALHQEKEIIPIMVKETRFSKKSELYHIQSLPQDSKGSLVSVTDWRESDNPWPKIVDAINDRIGVFQESRSSQLNHVRHFQPEHEFSSLVDSIKCFLNLKDQGPPIETSVYRKKFVALISNSGAGHKLKPLVQDLVETRSFRPYLVSHGRDNAELPLRLAEYVIFDGEGDVETETLSLFIADVQSCKGLLFSSTTIIFINLPETTFESAKKLPVVSDNIQFFGSIAAHDLTEYLSSLKN